jgi:hypothetical protein
MSGGPPSITSFTRAERQVIQRCSTPARVQRFLNGLRYNTEPPPVGVTLRSFRQVVRRRTAHCLEAALAAACIMEQHGYPPLLLDIHSIDNLDHVVFVYRKGGRWGSVARSRDPGLHGRKPVFASLRALAMSYFDPYIDFTGRLTAYSSYDLRRLAPYDWRLSSKNMWHVQRVLIAQSGTKLKVARGRVRRLRTKYKQHMAAHNNKKPVTYYRGREKWTPIPDHFL